MSKQEDIKRLIELKQMESKATEDKKTFEDKLAEELRELQLKYEELAAMSIEQMEEESQKESLIEVAIKSKVVGSIVDEYKNRFSDEDWYKEPEVEDGRTNLTFPSKEAMQDFVQDMAQEKKSFAVIDTATNKVMAYSNGDGNLYHGDGKVFNEGDQLEPCGVNHNEFKMPEKIGSRLSAMAETVTTPVPETSTTGPQEEVVDAEVAQQEKGVDDEEEQDVRLGNR